MSLLCEDCLRANVGREFAKVLGVEPPRSDAEAVQLLEDLPQLMQDDVPGGADPGEPEK
jgi:hypothetical protein